MRWLPHTHQVLSPFHSTTNLLDYLSPLLCPMACREFQNKTKQTHTKTFHLTLAAKFSRHLSISTCYSPPPPRLVDPIPYLKLLQPRGSAACPQRLFPINPAILVTSLFFVPFGQGFSFFSLPLPIPASPHVPGRLSLAGRVQSVLSQMPPAGVFLISTTNLLLHHTKEQPCLPFLFLIQALTQDSLRDC